MAYCCNCGRKVPDNTKFCAFCDTYDNSKRRVVYEGETHQCPQCGEVLDSFITHCPTCKFEFRGIKTNSPVEQLIKKLERASSVDEKIELITNFYVPNTREDIYDFFILAVSNLEDTAYDTDDAWRAKLEQTYHKAKISFSNTSELEYIEKLYNRTRSKVAKRGFSNFVRKNKKLCIAASLVATGLLFLLFGIILISNNNELGGFLILFAVFFIGFFPLILYLDELENKQ